MENAVAKIPGGASQQQRQTGRGSRRDSVGSNQIPGNDRDDHQRARDKQIAHQVRIAVGENTEGNAGILAVNQVNKIMHQLVAPAFEGLGFDGGFGEPVEENHSQREYEPAQARGMDHGNLEAEAVKEVEEIKEPVGAIMLHRLKSVAQEDEPG